jgi:thiol-disulfide isomerase/thioredoxin
MLDLGIPHSRILRWLVDIALFAVIFLVVQAWQQRDIPSGKAPQTGGYLATGEDFCLNDWREHHPGKVVALHFWANWCPICKAEEGSITAVAKDWPVITVAMQSGPADKVTKHLKNEGLDWATLVDDTGRISADYGLKGVPAFVVIDEKGIIRSVSTGYTSELGMRVRLWWADYF